jgi:hypothetical protein
LACRPKAKCAYAEASELYSDPIPDALEDAQKVVSRMKITEIEGILTHIFSTIPADRKLEIRTEVVAQYSKFRQIAGGSDLIQAAWVTKMRNALVFK